MLYGLKVLGYQNVEFSNDSFFIFIIPYLGISIIKYSSSNIFDENKKILYNNLIMKATI